jgi:4-hydroxybenzoate polyprenyltransferase
MWIYSHKLKRILYLGNVLAALLAITPFFALFIYFRNFYPVIFVHGLFLFLLFAMKELVKDLENLRGDMVQDYHTIPVVQGDVAAKKYYSVLTLISILPVAALVGYFEIGYMDYYFTLITGALLVCLPLLWTSGRRREYLLIHFILKVIIGLGVFSIVLVDLDGIVGKLGEVF